MLSYIRLILALLYISVGLTALSVSSGSVGGFTVSVEGLQVTVSSSSYRPRVLWSTAQDIDDFIRIGTATASAPISNGNCQLHEDVALLSCYQTIDTLHTNDDTHAHKRTGDDEDSEVFRISGRLLSCSDRNTVAADYTLTFTECVESENHLCFSVNVSDIRGDYDSDSLRLFLSYTSQASESFHGFGESFTGFNLKGRRVPVLVSEQGVGRGLEPITSYLNTQVEEGVGGHWYTTYAPKPLYVTNLNRSVFLDNSEVSVFDLQNPDMVDIELWGAQMRGRILFGESMVDLVKELTLITGRMPLPPAWTQKGAVVGLEGGTENVSSTVASLLNAGVPIAGVWLQDWVGMRHDWDGDRLIWNWEVNYEWYPGWHDMVNSWANDDIRVLTYINPFFSDPANYTSSYRRNFYREGIERGYFVKKVDGSPYTLYSLSIEFTMLDPTNPEAMEWMKNDVIRSMSLDEAQSSGWMADFGEYLPFDAVLHSGESAASYHNRYPEDWARITRDAITEAGREEDVVFFMRSAWTRAPKYVPVYWLGDQLISWDREDGLGSVVLGALSGGLCGHTITHSDIGGYTTETDLGPDMTYTRSSELLMRWSELAAFGSAMFRTHIGSSRTPLNAQVYDSPESMKHFATFASVFSALAAYREMLMLEAHSSGLPLMRPLAMHYGYDAEAWRVDSQFLFGEEFLVTPCTTEGASSVEVYFPKFSGPWVHLWSGAVVLSPADGRGMWRTIDSPIGHPAVFFKQGSVYGDELRNRVRELGMSSTYTSSHHTDYSNGLSALLIGFGAVLLVVVAVIFSRRRKLWTQPDSADVMNGTEGYSVIPREDI